MDLAAAVAVYVSGRAARAEITALSATHLRSRLGSLVTACPAGLAVDGLERAHIAAWQATIGTQRPASRRAYLSTVKVFCRWAALEGLLGHDPTVAAARVREPRRARDRNLSAARLARLELVLPDGRAQLIVSLMAAMGLRCVEVARLAVGDYDPDAATLKVWGKNDEGRTLPVPDPTAILLDAGPARRAAGPVVGLGSSRISVLVSGWMAQAGIKTGTYDGVSAHALRHTFAANMLARCHDVRLVQQALGHASLATTQRYLPGADLDQLRAAMCA